MRHCHIYIDIISDVGVHTIEILYSSIGVDENTSTTAVHVCIGKYKRTYIILVSNPKFTCNSTHYSCILKCKRSHTH